MSKRFNRSHINKSHRVNSPWNFILPSLFAIWLTVFLSLHPDGQEEARPHQEQARPEERQEITKEINDDELFWEKNKRKCEEKNLEQPMKKNTGAVYLALGLKRFPLERPRVLRKLKCHIWLAPELLSVLSWGSLSGFFFLLVLFFCLFFFVCFFTLYLNVWRGIGLLYLVFGVDF